MVDVAALSLVPPKQARASVASTRGLFVRSRRAGERRSGTRARAKATAWRLAFRAEGDVPCDDGQEPAAGANEVVPRDTWGFRTGRE